MTQQIVGGGTKKILYALSTLKRMGVVKGGKALTSKNACKACALGMGGQKGGMTNERGEYPAVCNKSVQAQSTDIQPEIPEPIFDYALSEFQELSGREMEMLGRLNTPILKRRGEDRFTPVAWEEAMAVAAARLRATEPERSFFYSSGRSSNEAGFLFQLFARLYGTNNVNNCSYYCHQASGVGLGTTIGTGTATVELEDLTGCDLIFIIGANPSSNHPRLIHKLKDCRARGGKVVVINPAREPGLIKFALPKSPRSLMKGGDEIASHYVQPRIGEDMALFKGLAKALLALGAEDRDFIARYTENFEGFEADIAATDWETITTRSGVSKEQIFDIARLYAASRSAVFAWGMGMTHHRHGTENVEYIAALALMRGMIGRRFAGLLPLRGHSNVQGIGTIGVKPVLAEEVMARMEETLSVSLPRSKGLDTLGVLRAAHAGDMNSAVIMGGNLFEGTPNTAWARDALERIGFKLFLTTTLNRGHVHGVGQGETLILPVTARDEEWEPTTQESMFNFVRLSDGGISRLANVRPETVILADLASRVLPDAGIDFKEFARHRTIREAIARVVPDMSELADIDIAKREFHIANRLLHKPAFKTASGRAAFQTRPLPVEKQGGFMLTTLRSEGQFNSIVYEEKDSYRGTGTRWSVLMNAQDMARLGVRKFATVDLRSAKGEMKAVTVYPFDLPPGSVAAYYPEANILADDSDHDPRSLTPAFKSIPIDVIAC